MSYTPALNNDNQTRGTSQPTHTYGLRNRKRPEPEADPDADREFEICSIPPTIHDPPPALFEENVDLAEKVVKRARKWETGRGAVPTFVPIAVSSIDSGEDLHKFGKFRNLDLECPRWNW